MFILYAVEPVEDGYFPYWVKLTEKDGLWSWETDERGATGFASAEDALAASQKVREQLKGW